jgi:hypothetical protein
MKTLQTAIIAITSILFFASCGANSSQSKALLDEGQRMEIMNTIANDSVMSMEMISIMSSGKNGMMMQQHYMGNQQVMMKIFKDNPDMMNSMMSHMLETANNDSTMMNGMYKIMSDNPQMMQMMYMRSNENGMGHMGGQDNK